jgi:hypothetical protein
MGISDDWPYILMAQKLAATGHVVYNGWASPMLGWQLYLAAAFIKLLGFSPTVVRMSILLVAAALAFVLQRVLVRANISERNATIGTLALVLSPLYLMLSVTFMTDISGLFAIVLCLYGCLRAFAGSDAPRDNRLAVLCGCEQRHLRHFPPERVARHPRDGPLHPLAPASPAPRSYHRRRIHPCRHPLHPRVHALA